MHVRLFCVLSVMWLTLCECESYARVCVCVYLLKSRACQSARVCEVCAECVLGGNNSLSLPVSQPVCLPLCPCVCLYTCISTLSISLVVCKSYSKVFPSVK